MSKSSYSREQAANEAATIDQTPARRSLAAWHWHSSTPDLDKLCRSIGDALTGVVLADDRQIATWHAHKVYTAGSEGATVEIRELLENER